MYISWEQSSKTGSKNERLLLNFIAHHRRRLCCWTEDDIRTSQNHIFFFPIGWLPNIYSNGKFHSSTDWPYPFENVCLNFASHSIFDVSAKKLLNWWFCFFFFKNKNQNLDSKKILFTVTEKAFFCLLCLTFIRIRKHAINTDTPQLRKNKHRNLT